MAGNLFFVEPTTSRRGFLKLMTNLMIGLVAAVLTVPLVGGLIGSSFRLKKSRWADVGDISSLPADQYEVSLQDERRLRPGNGHSRCLGH